MYYLIFRKNFFPWGRKSFTNEKTRTWLKSVYIVDIWTRTFLLTIFVCFSFNYTICCQLCSRQWCYKELQLDCWFQKYLQPKSWELFYLMGIFRTLSLRDSISSNSERTALRRWGVRLYRSFATRAGSQNIKRVLLIKENQIT